MSGFALVVNERNEILLIQRAERRYKGLWSLPGGKKDKGESLQETAIRETCEETGIKITAHRRYHKNERHGFEIWRGKPIGGRLQPQKEECLDAKWFQKDMLPHDECLAIGPDKSGIRKWADENPGENPRSRRVHYPRSKMDRAGFGLVVNDRKEILLVQRSKGRRAGKWTLPGGNAGKGKDRRKAAVYWTRKATGMGFTPDRLYYENRHHAQIWLGKPPARLPSHFDGHWFALDALPDDNSLAFAVDVRTIEKWAAENSGSGRASYPQ